MNPNIRTLVLAMSLAMSSGAIAANAAFVTDLENGKQIATTFDPMTEISIFANLPNGTNVMVNSEKNAIVELAQFFGPEAKTVLCRFHTEYQVLKNLAIKHGVTTPQRLADTNVVAVTDLAMLFGITDIDAYALKRGLVTFDDYKDGGIAYETKVLTTVSADINARIASGELQQVNHPASSIVQAA